MIERRPPARTRPLIVGLLLIFLGACAHTPDNNPAAPPGEVAVHDPAEPVNRVLFGFNRVVDNWLLKPLATAYGWLPEPVNDGVHNVVTNLSEPGVFINDLLQGNGRRSANTLGRFLTNSTVGVLGIFDVASHWRMPYHDADMGQTLGVWGIGDGPIIELPLLGSSNSRDATGRVIGLFLDPFGQTDSETVDTIKTGKRVAGTLDNRYQALPLTDRLEQSPDYYQAMRDYIARRRAELVFEGRVGAVAPEAANDDATASPEQRPTPAGAEAP
ncbi:VacJ family lipoprotein [Alloalcanivorax sp. C16-2]|uniref:MlaA family lipoprotein n=1 Tax=Alloalcanivorax sp. C16-2 TaxID=3390052 RepID=UPI003970EFA3